MDEFPRSIRFRMEGETVPFASFPPPPSCSIGWMVKREAGGKPGRSVSRFSARRSVTFPRIKFESIFLSVILVTPAYNNVGGKRSRVEREREIGSIFLETFLLLSRRPVPSVHDSRREMARCRGDTWFIRGRSCAPTTLPPATPRERRSFLMERARWPRCSREKWSREREREGGCVALIEAGEKQVYENRKRYCNRARKLPERDESSSFLTRRSTGILPILPKMNICILRKGRWL